MKIIDNTEASAPRGLRIDETLSGEVYYYDTIARYVLRRADDPDRPFVDLEEGYTWTGEDGRLYRVDASLHVTRPRR